MLPCKERLSPTGDTIISLFCFENNWKVEGKDKYIIFLYTLYVILLKIIRPKLALSFATLPLQSNSSSYFLKLQ
jgi:hypothetical protein